MLFPDKRNPRREFNPFNIQPEKNDNKYQIKFERGTSRIKTKPFWWLAAIFIIAFMIYIYLRTIF
jgi:hypothetical protein